MDSPFVILIPLFLIGFIALAIYGAHLAAKRREALMRVAQQLHLAFNPSTDSYARTRAPYRDFGEFQRGSRERAYNTLSGEIRVGAGIPLDVLAGDWSYQTTSGSGKNRRKTTHRFSYALVSLPYMCPPLRVRPEHFLDRMAAAIGFNDLDFESAEFSDAFHVSATDERFTYDLLHPQMMEMMLAERPPAFQVDRGWLLICGGGTWSPGQFVRYLSFAGRFVEHWPRHLVEAASGGVR